eukprot:1945277-Rhodomonas_salina.1
MGQGPRVGAPTLGRTGAQGGGCRDRRTHCRRCGRGRVPDPRFRGEGEERWGVGEALPAED